ncbi:Glycoside hydrolase superfamily [Acididesulfobacillus acetoxydans]|uniref:Amylopullulanase n=1 Tax=Acididesulfobacillus acetoxydans TaxID=1561005 RepID=A0A8S0X6R7_9FIRM|nr:glycoside hydrolase family 13 protein [Acididesulfobacillus acetoxydans]CAA7602780.1 Glycoside hydrolase superfamily [Acididesulfobacillus acetoxydans]CEJ06363.1 Amylopullulanase [Acididesulfobacillus acetoxydans]
MEFNAYHDSHNLFYRNPFGAVPCGSRVRFRLKTRSMFPVEACYLRLWLGEREKLVPMSPAAEKSEAAAAGEWVTEAEEAAAEAAGAERGERPVHVEEPAAEAEEPAVEAGAPWAVFEAVYEVREEPGLLWYYFRVRAGGREFYYGNNEDKLGGEGALWAGEPPSYQLTVYRPMRIPKWYTRGIMYQIFVERFHRAQAGSPGSTSGTGQRADGEAAGAGGPGSKTGGQASSGGAQPATGGQIVERAQTRIGDSPQEAPDPAAGRQEWGLGSQAGNRAGRPRQNALLHLDWYDTPIYVKDDRGRVTHWDFFGGNLEGLIAKLPYLQELGVSILYLNPIFEAASNHKYDTADYQRIDPMYGDEEVFECLIREAKQRGISLVLDGVFSHTGSDSLYFNREGTYPGLGACQSPASPYFEWYQFRPDSRESGERKAGELESAEPKPGGTKLAEVKTGEYGDLAYKSWWGIDTLPEVDELKPSWQKFLFDPEDGVIQKWMKKGVAGWRLDVADELPDEFIRKLRETVKSLNSEAVLIGEVWEDASNKFSYGKLRRYFWGDELDATMNYPWREIFLRFLLGEEDAPQVYRRVMSLYENYPRENFFAAMNLVGSHDRVRILTLLGEAPPEEGLADREKRTWRLSVKARQLAVRRLKLFTLIQMTFPGVPCIYYGDEAGLEGYSDPYNRGTYPWGREDAEILEWHKQVARLRREHKTLQAGGFQAFSCGPDVFGFRRFGVAEQIMVLVNRHTSEAREAVLPPALSPDPGLSLPLLDLLSGESLRPAAKRVGMGPLSARVLLCLAPHTMQRKDDSDAAQS